ncbi:TetR/AcrR family transcriptional regulator [Nocardioides sp.]|jgi:AcrR family transcriptional regulator|uniref:TetR/AcrR family transcriptional regulator n=1 Tax=Nocardioides sp. TaxID=35761 RepID=UPI00261F0B28|nr:TetR/AcrR family transcriptional regulator [Nocardioides sp.]
MRADAVRNRERIIEAARAVFREKGYDAPLDEIARRAEVGPGTLYRHFATREALHDAVMQAWVDNVTSSKEKVLASTNEGRELLLEWLETYVRLISYNKGTPAKLTAAIDDASSPLVTKCQALREANEAVLGRLEGAMRSDVNPIQVVKLVGGVASMADQSEMDAAAVRPLLEVVADGLLR